MILRILFLAALVHNVAGFNIDVSSPIIYTDPSNYSGRLTRNTYFGFSVILYEGITKDESWIQMGAPRANVSEQPMDNEPGSVYRCPIGQQCKTFPVNRVTKYTGKTHTSSYEILKNGSWIGVSMDIHEPSQRVVVCGNRWINILRVRKVDYLMQGACYWWNAFRNERALYPLVIKEKYYYNSTSGKSRTYDYGMGQLGTSVHLSNSHNEPNIPKLLIGAPGIRNAGGSVVLYEDAQIIPSYVNKRSANIEHFSKEFIDINEYGHRFSYAGYSLTSGHFFDKEEQLYAVGAPRGRNFNGEVIIIKVFTPGKPINLETAIKFVAFRQGTTPGAYFGASLAAGDFNKDGYDDLVVGAPQQTNNAYGEGCVYIYYGIKGNYASHANSSILGKARNGQFGLAMQSLGDIDSDGYEDLAIAAPYEDDHRGVIYIYNGGESGLILRPSQRIAGREISMELRAFGISFSRPSDIDKNHVKDLAVGSYLSGHTVLLRSYPLAQLNLSLNANITRLNTNATGFGIRICSWYLERNTTGLIDIRLTLMIDIVHERLYKDTKTDNRTTSWIAKLFVNQKHCHNITLIIKDDNVNWFDPIEISVTQKLLTPKLNHTTVWVKNQTVGTDSFNPSHLLTHRHSILSRSVRIPFLSECRTSGQCVSDLKLSSEFTGLSSIDTFVVGSKNPVHLKVNVSNAGEPAYLTDLELFLPEDVTLSATPLECDNAAENIRKFTCQIANPLRINTAKTILFPLNMDKVVYSPKSLIFHVVTSTKSDDLSKDDNDKKIILNLDVEANLTITATSPEENYYFGNGTDLLSFHHHYEVRKNGASPVENVMLTMQIPVSVDSPKERIDFLRIYKPVSTGGNKPISCHSTVPFIAEQEDNSDRGEGDLLDEDFIEAKREKRSVVANAMKKMPPANRTLFLNCSSSFVRCVDIICDIGLLKDNLEFASFDIEMVLNTSALLEFLTDQKDIIYISTDGRVEDAEEIRSVRLSSAFRGEMKVVEVETWIYIVSAVAGLLILFLLVAGLVKAGFFQRKKKDELQALKETTRRGIRTHGRRATLDLQTFLTGWD